jgi:hypothetical protein
MALFLTLHNDGTGTDAAANYTVTVSVNDRIIERGRVEGHNRAHGWRPLVRAYLDAAPAEAPPSSDVAIEIQRQAEIRRRQDQIKGTRGDK